MGFVVWRLMNLQWVIVVLNSFGCRILWSFLKANCPIAGNLNKDKIKSVEMVLFVRFNEEYAFSWLMVSYRFVSTWIPRLFRILHVFPRAFSANGQTFKENNSRTIIYHDNSVLTDLFVLWKWTEKVSCGHLHISFLAIIFMKM